MSDNLDALLSAQGGVATTAQLLDVLGRARFESWTRSGDLAVVWTGVWSRDEPDTTLRLNGVDLRAGEPVALCLGTAAAAYGFDVQNPSDLHVLNPVGHQLRSSDGLVVHRREGAPLVVVDGRLATSPEWTAIEVARSLRRPRALATLDAALRSGTCDVRGFRAAAAKQVGRRGIVAVRDLIPLARPGAESPMESEARLAMLDYGLPEPVLQFEIVDRNRRTWRVDFAWPDRMVAVEYDGFDWHSSQEHFQRDRQKVAALREIDWTVLSIIDDDVRRRSWDMALRIDHMLTKAAA